MRDRSYPSSEAHSSVQQDWRAWLPEDKDHLFHRLTQQLETPYAMVSVSLNEAISLRLAGHLPRCRQAASVLADLNDRLAEPLVAMLRALASHARHYGTVPNAAPLNPANFRGARRRRAARMSSLLSHVLLSQQSQFLHKVDELEGMVEDLAKEFRAAVAEVVDMTSVEPAELWLEIDLLHYDLNTCLRESIVILKSFLIVLPHEELTSFEEAARVKPVTARPSEANATNFRNGRAAKFGGK